MDLIGAESRKSGTRGGRDQFNWDNVKRGEKEFYLGNSVAGTRPMWEVERDTQPINDAVSAGIAGSAVRDNIGNHNIGNRNEGELAAVRRRERAVLNAALGGGSYSEAVQAVLHESDSTTRAKTTADDMEIVAQSIGEANLEDTDKLIRKEERRRRREERKIRREARQKRRELRAVRTKEALPGGSSSETENEDKKKKHKKMHHAQQQAQQQQELSEMHRPKRRRTERQTGSKRKRSEVSSSDMVR